MVETKRDLQDVVSIADRNVETFLRERVDVHIGRLRRSIRGGRTDDDLIKTVRDAGYALG